MFFLYFCICSFHLFSNAIRPAVIVTFVTVFVVFVTRNIIYKCCNAPIFHRSQCFFLQGAAL
jgi:hypothetical protein